jgi:antitoxin MazE
MVKTVTVRQTGSSVSAVIPRDMADRMHLGAGDPVFMVETEDGVLMTPYDPTVASAMDAYDKIAKKHRNAFRALSRK